MEYVISLVETTNGGEPRKEWSLTSGFLDMPIIAYSPYFGYLFEEAKRIIGHSDKEMEGRWIDEGTFRLWSTFPYAEFDGPLDPLMLRPVGYPSIQYWPTIDEVDLTKLPTGWVSFDRIFTAPRACEYVIVDEAHLLKGQLDQPKDLLSLIQL